MMHYIEEIASNESILDCKERKAKEKQYEEEDECEEQDKDVKVIEVTTAKAKQIIGDNPSKQNEPTYYVHESVDDVDDIDEDNLLMSDLRSGNCSALEQPLRNKLQPSAAM